MGVSGLKRSILGNQRLRPIALRIAMKCLVRPRLARLGVPIIAVTGTNGKTTVVRLLTRIFCEAGYNVGACTTDGVTHNEAVVTRDDEAWGRGAWRAARCPKVDVLVLETARGGLKNYGPGFKQCHLGVVTNLFEDHLGFNGIHTMEQMAEVKSAVPRAVRKDGALVLNGDDPLVRAMAGKSAAEPVYFVMGEDHDRFDRAFFVRDGSIWTKTGAEQRPVISIAEIPIASRGLQAYNVANAMAALAAAEGMKRFLAVPGGAAETAVRGFGTDPGDNPGRSHLITLEGERFLIFYAKNPESFRLEVDVVNKVKQRDGFEHVVGAIAAPGNRVSAYYRDISRVVAPVCDLVLVRAPQEKYLRGRSPQEIVRLLSSSIPEEKVLEDPTCTVSDLIALSRRRLGGRTLFVLFTALFDPGPDLDRLLAQAEAYHPLAVP